MNEKFINAEVIQNHINIDDRITEIKNEKENKIKEVRSYLTLLNEEELLLMKNKSLVERSIQAIIYVLQEHADEVLDILYIKKRVYKKTKLKIELIEPLLVEAFKKDQNIRFLSDGRVQYNLKDNYRWHLQVDNLKKFTTNLKGVAEYLDIPTTTVSKMSRALESEGYSFYKSEKRNPYSNAINRSFNEKDILLLEQMKNKKEENYLLSFEDIAVNLILIGEEKEKRIKFLNEDISWDIKKVSVFMGYEIKVENYFELTRKIIEIVFDQMPDKLKEIEKDRHFPSQYFSKNKKNLESKNKKVQYLFVNGFYLIKGKTNNVYKNIIKFLLIKLDIPFEDLSPIINPVKKEQIIDRASNIVDFLIVEEKREFISPDDNFTEDIVLEAYDKPLSMAKNEISFINDEEDDLI